VRGLLTVSLSVEVVVWRKVFLVFIPLMCAALCLGLWHVVVRAEGGSDLTLPEGSFAGPCDDWTQVNDGAFGVASTAHTYPEGDYYTEDAFEVVVFEGQLYVGMEADDVYGAQIWRSKPGISVAVTQTDWEEVAQVNGLPFGNATFAVDTNGAVKLQNDHIDSLEGFKGALYASTANGGNTKQGIVIYRSTTGAAGTWVPVIDAGFGFTENVNFKEMQVFQGWLCGGTQNAATGAQVWCTEDGEDWDQKNHGGFGATSDDPETFAVWSGYVYSDSLYFGTQRATPEPGIYQGVLYRTANISSIDPVWTSVYTSPWNGYRIDILGDIGNYLYISYQDPENGIVILRSENADAGTWVPVNLAGMDYNRDNIGTVVDGATVYNGMLYCAVTNIVSGTQVWRTDGVNRGGGLAWSQVSPPGLGHTGNRTAELITWNGYLYAWTSNDVSGQEVRRTSCAICQTQDIDGSGRYDFTAVGTTLTFTVESLDGVTVCVYPGLMPVHPWSGAVLSRMIEVSPSPPRGSFTADIALTYEPRELDPAAVNSPTLYLRYWAGDAWATSCEADHDTTARTITCRNLKRFSAWITSGTPGRVTSVRLNAIHTEPTLVGLGLTCFFIVMVLVWQHRNGER
jgi:hypothetical protein